MISTGRPSFIEQQRAAGLAGGGARTWYQHSNVSHKVNVFFTDLKFIKMTDPWGQMICGRRGGEGAVHYFVFRWTTLYKNLF